MILFKLNPGIWIMHVRIKREVPVPVQWNTRDMKTKNWNTLTLASVEHVFTWSGDNLCSFFLFFLCPGHLQLLCKETWNALGRHFSSIPASTRPFVSFAVLLRHDANSNNRSPSTFRFVNYITSTLRQRKRRAPQPSITFSWQARGRVPIVGDPNCGGQGGGGG